MPTKKLVCRPCKAQQSARRTADGLDGHALLGLLRPPLLLSLRCCLLGQLLRRRLLRQAQLPAPLPLVLSWATMTSSSSGHHHRLYYA